MTLKQKREKLIAELLKVKDEGLRVFICNSDYYAYGIMTDGINIIYVQFSDYGIGFSTIFEYVPKRTTGSGCSTLESGYEYRTLSKDIFYETVEIGKRKAFKYGVTLYKNFEQYFTKDKKDRYIEL